MVRGRATGWKCENARDGMPLWACRKNLLTLPARYTLVICHMRGTLSTAIAGEPTTGGRALSAGNRGGGPREATGGPWAGPRGRGGATDGQGPVHPRTGPSRARGFQFRCAITRLHDTITSFAEYHAPTPLGPYGPFQTPNGLQLTSSRAFSTSAARTMLPPHPTRTAVLLTLSPTDTTASGRSLGARASIL